MKYEVTYEVYRYKQWWKNTMIVKLDVTLTIFLEPVLMWQAYWNDLWEIRNLTYKEIDYD